MSYYDYFLNSPSSVVELELFEISHPSFSKVYRIVRNSAQGITATLEAWQIREITRAGGSIVTVFLEDVTKQDECPYSVGDVITLVGITIGTTNWNGAHAVTGVNSDGSFTFASAGPVDETQFTGHSTLTVFFEYYPLQISSGLISSDDLDQAISIDLGDLGTVIPQELDAINAAGTFDKKPTLVYRTFRSDDLSAPMYGPNRFKVNDISFKKQGASFDASAPKVNSSATGKIYTIDVFPMLQGFL